jgi:hypothetical protein
MLKFLKVVSGVVVVAAMPTTARAESIVNVTLIDRAGTTDLSKSMNLGMGMKGNMKTAKTGTAVHRSTPRLGGHLWSGNHTNRTAAQSWLVLNNARRHIRSRWQCVGMDVELR